MNEKERRSFEFEVRADQNEQHGTFITGTPIVFEQGLIPYNKSDIEGRVYEIVIE